MANVSHGPADQIRQMAEVSHCGTLTIFAVILERIVQFSCLTFYFWLSSSVGIRQLIIMSRPTQRGQRYQLNIYSVDRLAEHPLSALLVLLVFLVVFQHNARDKNLLHLVQKTTASGSAKISTINKMHVDHTVLLCIGCQVTLIVSMSVHGCHNSIKFG